MNRSFAILGTGYLCDVCKSPTQWGWYYDFEARTSKSGHVNHNRIGKGIFQQCELGHKVCTEMPNYKPDRVIIEDV